MVVTAAVEVHTVALAASLWVVVSGVRRVKIAVTEYAMMLTLWAHCRRHFSYMRVNVLAAGVQEKQKAARVRKQRMLEMEVQAKQKALKSDIEVRHATVLRCIALSWKFTDTRNV